MLDNNLYLKASGAETTSTTGSATDFGGPDGRETTYVINVTAAAGTSPTLDVTISECATSGGTYTSVLKFPQITAVGVYRLTGKCSERYRKYASVFTGTNPSFTYSIFPELGGEYTKF